MLLGPGRQGSGGGEVTHEGGHAGVLARVLAGEAVGTVFPAKESHLRLRKSWLAFGKRIEGDLCVDRGCEQAMRAHGSSLLAAGITSCEGDFAGPQDGDEVLRALRPPPWDWCLWPREEVAETLRVQTRRSPRLSESHLAVLALAPRRM